MNKFFDIAVVGCGGVSSMHFEGYAGHPERVRVVAACDPEVSRAREAAERWEIPAAFGSVEEMIASASFEVGVVCTPTPVREPVIRALAAAGKHVFAEKPLADSYDEACRIVAACRDAGVWLAVDQNLRYHYPFYQARELIHAGRIGRPLGLTHHDLCFRQDRGWRTGQQRHVLAVQGIHWLDGFRWMLGSEARSILCRAHFSPALDVVGETDAFLQIAFGNGVTASYVESFSSSLRRTETLILGEEGLLSLGYRGTALHRRGTEAQPPPEESWTNPYAGPGKPESAFIGLEHLLTAIETGQAPPNSGTDNLHSVAMLDAAYRSAAEGRPVELNDGVPR